MSLYDQTKNELNVKALIRVIPNCPFYEEYGSMGSCGYKGEICKIDGMLEKGACKQYDIPNVLELAEKSKISQETRVA